MAFLKRAPTRANSTPVLDRSAGQSFRRSLAAALAIPAIPTLLLASFGQPALRFQYRYHGPDSSPVFTHCRYLALDGWHDIRPVFDVERCPVITVFPIDIINFIGG